MNTVLVLVIVGVVLLGGALLVVLPRLVRRKLSPAEAARVRVQLRKIGQMPAREAVFEHHKLLDYALRHSGVAGRVAAQRLQRVGASPALWRAHRLRNQLAHEVGFAPSQRALDAANAELRRATLARMPAPRKKKS